MTREIENHLVRVIHSLLTLLAKRGQRPEVQTAAARCLRVLEALDR